jgi:hypothetical protein
MSTPETFSDWEVEQAVRQFLEFGVQTFGTAHKGYYAGGGWAARCLRFHLEQLKAQNLATKE